MPMKLLSADEFRNAAKDGKRPEGTVFRFATEEPKMQDEATRKMRFVFSDATVDHAGDSIDPKGWDLSIFNRNPVALFAHNSWDPPIGRASDVYVQGEQLVGDIEFATADVYEFADTIYRLVKGKFLKAVSVGFMPKDWAWSSDKDRPYGIDFKKQQLLEISVCPVPCNPNALGEARSMGIDTRSLSDWAEKVLDSGDTVFLPRKDLEALRTQSKIGAEPRYYIQGKAHWPASFVERLRTQVKSWQVDPREVLILPEGVELRQIASVVADPSISTPLPIDDDLDVDALIEGIKSGAIEPADARATLEKTIAVAKSGRRISSATKAKLTEAMTHHEAMGSCIKDLMDEDAGDDGDAEPDGDADDQTLQPEPPGTIIPEDMTAEQRRMKEARDLRASLPPID